MPFHSVGVLPESGMEHGSPTLEVDSLPSGPPGKPLTNVNNVLKIPSLSSLANKTAPPRGMSVGLGVFHKGKLEVYPVQNLQKLPDA